MTFAELPKIEKYNLSSYHIMIVKFDLNKLKFNYKQIFNKFNTHLFLTNEELSILRRRQVCRGEAARPGGRGGVWDPSVCAEL